MIFPVGAPLLLGLLASASGSSSDCDRDKGGRSYDNERGDVDYWKSGGPGRALADYMIDLQEESSECETGTAVPCGWRKFKYKIKACPELDLEPEKERASLDNSATVHEIRFLLWAAKETEEDKYLEAATEGVRFILEAQHAKGGWPQFFPLVGDGYQNEMTFNDNAHINAMEILEDLLKGEEPFDVCDSEMHSCEDYERLREEDAPGAYELAVRVILEAQIDDPSRRGGECPERIGWCAQHGRANLAPVWGRDYEPPSFSGKEGVNLAAKLMSLEERRGGLAGAIDDALDQAESNSGRRIEDAIKGAYVWAKKSELTGYEEVEVNDDKTLETCSDCPSLWPRFNGLDDLVPIFCDEDCKDDSSEMYFGIPDGWREMGDDRRNGYDWLVNNGKEFIEEFDAWGAVSVDQCCYDESVSCSSPPTPPSVCQPDQCIDRCIDKYGGDASSGKSYYCAKGCAQLERGDVTNVNKFCVVCEDTRHDVCVDSCKTAGNEDDQKEACRHGCNHWCPSDKCIARCIDNYGGDALSGDSYYCAKGCAQLDGGEVTDANKFCNEDKGERSAICVDSCATAGRQESQKDACRCGCQFWSQCQPNQCIERCIDEYGGDASSGNSYYCAKGCAQLDDGQVTDENKFCNVCEDARFDTCMSSCETAGRQGYQKAACRYGCQFWPPPPTPNPTPEPTPHPTMPACETAGCIDRCIEQYGGILTIEAALTYVHTYNCIKGCVGMDNDLVIRSKDGGQVTDPSKFCTYDEEDRYDICMNSCTTVTGDYQAERRCSYGCQFWIQTECPYDDCIGRCKGKYGSDGLSGNSYWCSKGCAQMDPLRVTDPNKFCSIDGGVRYDSCMASCAPKKRDRCRYGCQFWLEPLFS